MKHINYQKPKKICHFNSLPKIVTYEDQYPEFNISNHSANNKKPIRNNKHYKEAIDRATIWRDLLEDEESRIAEYFSFKRTHSKKTV